MYQLTLTSDPRSKTMHAPVVKELPDLEFIFEAQISVDLASWNAFDEKLDGTAGPALVRIHEGAGLTLVNSSATASESTIDFVNYWRLGVDANSLARAEIKMSDNIVFAEFDKLVQRDETKNLLCRVKSVSPARSPGFDVKNAQYLRVVYDVQPRELEEFMARMEAHVPSFGRDHGWALGTAFVYHTGRGGRAVQLWLVPANLDLATCLAVVEKMPWRFSIRGEPLLRAKTPPAATLHQLTPFDPYFTGEATL